MATSEHSSSMQTINSEAEDTTLIPQCEVIADGSKGSKILYSKCTLHPGHEEYMTSWSQFEERSRREGMSDVDRRYVKNMYDRTVKIRVFYTSTNRPDKYLDGRTPYPYVDLRGNSKKERCGTGTIYTDFSYDCLSATLPGPCPCYKCANSGDKKEKYWRFKVITANHVIFDESEAQHTEFDVFYDSDNQTDKHTLYGYLTTIIDYTGTSGLKGDFCQVVCVAHDYELANRLNALLDEAEDFYRKRASWGPNGILISHPHGVWKHISMGNILHQCYIYYYRFPETQKNDTPPLKLKKGTRVIWSSRKDGDVFQTLASSREIDINNTCQSDERSNTDPTPTQNEEKCVAASAASGRDADSDRPNDENYVTLPFDAIINLPHNAKYAWQKKYYSTVGCHSCNLPRGAQLTSPEGEVLQLPTDSELSFPSLNDLICLTTSLNVFSASYYTYHIPTCGGSSGAHLLTGDYYGIKPMPHFGRCGDRNQSGLGISR